MMGREWEEGDIIVLEPETATDFEVITDVSNDWDKNRSGKISEATCAGKTYVK